MAAADVLGVANHQPFPLPVGLRGPRITSLLVNGLMRDLLLPTTCSSPHRHASVTALTRRQQIVADQGPRVQRRLIPMTGTGPGGPHSRPVVSHRDLVARVLSLSSGKNRGTERPTGAPRFATRIAAGSGSPGPGPKAEGCCKGYEGALLGEAVTAGAGFSGRGGRRTTGSSQPSGATIHPERRTKHGLFTTVAHGPGSFLHVGGRAGGEPGHTWELRSACGGLLMRHQLFVRAA